MKGFYMFLQILSMMNTALVVKVVQMRQRKLSVVVLVYFALQV